MSKGKSKKNNWEMFVINQEEKDGSWTIVMMVRLDQILDMV